MAPIAPSAAARARSLPVLTSDGRSVPWSALVDACRLADVVILGENHGHEQGLATAAALWRDVLAAEPRAVLALEFFERDQQLALDDFLSGVTDEASFLRQADRSPGAYPPAHRDMILASKAGGRPVLAANAPRRYVRLARTEGFDRLRTLGPTQAPLVRVPDELPSGRYRADFDAVMNANAGVNDKQLADPAYAERRRSELDAMFRSQLVWDWTMAQSVCAGLDHLGRPVVLVVGRFHSDFAGGTVQAIGAQRPGTRTVCVSFVDAPGSDGPSLAPTDAGRADFVIYVGASD